MKAPRYAQWLIVPTLVAGVGLGPVGTASAFAPARRPATPTVAEEAERTEVEPAEAAPSEAEPTETEPTEPAKAAPTKAAPTETEPSEAAPTEPAEAVPTEPAEAAPTETEPSEPAPTETEPTEPEITVRPRPPAPTTETSKIIQTSPGEVVTDPRRRRTDERLLFRAGLLSLGVAGLALVPTVIGLQQASLADREGRDDRERTMRGLGIGAGVVAGTYALTGIVLMSLGSRRRAERRATVAPVAGPGHVGAVLRARF